jgi:hypothetical protein
VCVARTRCGLCRRSRGSHPPLRRARAERHPGPTAAPPPLVMPRSSGASPWRPRGPAAAGDAVPSTAAARPARCRRRSPLPAGFGAAAHAALPRGSAQAPAAACAQHATLRPSGGLHANPAERSRAPVTGARAHARPPPAAATARQGADKPERSPWWAGAGGCTFLSRVDRSRWSAHSHHTRAARRRSTWDVPWLDGSTVA